MNIAKALQTARPHLTDGESYRVADFSDGRGPQLLWYSDEPEPTQAELEEANLKAVREAKRAGIRAELVSECEAVMPIWEFVFVVYTRTTDSRMPTLVAAAKKAREREAALAKAATLEEIGAC